MISSKSDVAEMEGAVKEVEIENAEHINDGEMRAVKVGEKDDDKVLVVRYEGKLHAISNKCSHFGAPLNMGLLFDDKVLCPFHSAGFNVTTGAPEFGPISDGLAKFEIIEKGGKYYVIVPDPIPHKITQHMAKRDPKNTKNFVIIGGGAAGLSCAEALR